MSHLWRLAIHPLRALALRCAPALQFESALRFALAFALAALLAGCGSSVKLPKLPADAVVLAFGDSLTFGSGAQTAESYPAVLEKLMARKVVGAGIPGEVSAAGLARLPGVLEEVKPQLLILCHGGNDLLRKTGEAQAADNLRAMIRLARQQGVSVVLVAVPKPGLLPSPAAFYDDIASEFKLPYESAALKSILTDSSLKSDLVHPNAKGYARLAEAIHAVIRKSGAI